MSLERPHSRASSGSRGPPPAPPPTYLWEELRRSRSKGGYPWTILYKPPLPGYLDIELLLKGEISGESFLDERTVIRSVRTSDKRTNIHNRFRDKERARRAKSEPTPSLPSTTSLSIMDQAMALDPSQQSDDGLEDFPLHDEDIPDFVMAYLQSDKGNLDEDIPDHILDYIQSRAAILERSQPHLKHSEDEIQYTKDELRIMDETRKRLEEQGELIAPEITEDVDAFDRYFQCPPIEQNLVMNVSSNTSYTRQQDFKELNPPGSEIRKAKKTGKFNFANIQIPNKNQLTLKLPKFGHGKKNQETCEDDEISDSKKKMKKPRRPQSASPMRQKINQQLESWNNSLRKFTATTRSRNQDGQINSFIALLPGRSSRVVKAKEAENQYEEVGLPRPSAHTSNNYNQPFTLSQSDKPGVKDIVGSIEQQADYSPAQGNEGEETMENIENIPESEVAELSRDRMIVDREVADVIVTRGEFVDIDIDEDFEDENTDVQLAQKVTKCDQEAISESASFAARSKKAFQITKSKIQTSLSKEQLQATRTKLQSTLSKQNLQATRKKMQSSLSKRNMQATRDKLQSTLSRENLQATRNKLQSSLNSTLKRKTNKNPKTSFSIPHQNIFLLSSSESKREYETSTPIERRTKRQVQERKFENSGTNPPTAKGRIKKKRKNQNISAVIPPKEESGDIHEELEDLEDELEPRLEFSLHGTERPRPPSVSQSTETLPEDEADSEKENVIIRPKRRRYRRRRHGFHEEFRRPHSVQSETETNIRSSWVEKSNVYSATSQEMLSAFSVPVNALECVDSTWNSLHKPDRPVRSRPKKETTAISEDHVYSNVPSDRVICILEKNVLEEKDDQSGKTWPRKRISEKPVVPKRFKSKTTKSSLPVYSNFQTWPRRSVTLSPPSAPKRTRSKGKVTDGLAYVHNVEEQIRKPTNNILTDADTLFGAESRFIDEEGIDNHISSPSQNIITASDCTIVYNITSEPSTAKEAKVINSGNSPRPLIPKRQRNQTTSLRKTKRNVAENYGESTWPLNSRTQPTVPQRRKCCGGETKRGGDTRIHLDLVKPIKKLPIVPASTPSEDAQDISCHIESENASSLQAGLDQILEILASTFPEELNKQENKDNENRNQPIAVPATVDLVTSSLQDIKVTEENPYAEIKQFQRKTPPPRPPPPIYTPSSASYSYIYTVPRRKKGLSKTNTPERPPRTYCTIRPHRPPRKYRTHVRGGAFLSTCEAESNPPRRHSISGGDSVAEERNLQSAPIVEKMRTRPLPDPPLTERQRSHSPPNKPPRSRTSSLKRNDPNTLQDNLPKEEDVVKEYDKRHVTSFEGYEPIASPSQVEEITIGIQTDPLPEYDETVMIFESSEVPEGQDPVVLLDVEINNNIYRHDEGVINQLGIEETGEEQLETREDSPLSDPCKQPILHTQSETPLNLNNEELSTQNWSTVHFSDTEQPVSHHNNADQCQNSHAKKILDACKPNVNLCTDDNETSCFSQIPVSFSRSIAPLPPISVELPTRMQLSELDVERLNVREVMADRIVVSTVDTNTFQVCQMTTSTESGQLLVSVGHRLTIPLLTTHNEENKAQPSEQTSSSSNSNGPSLSLISKIKEDEEIAILPQKEQSDMACNNENSSQLSCKFNRKALNETEITALSTNDTSSSLANVADVHPNQVPQQFEEPSVTDLTMQLAVLSSRRLTRNACAAVSQTYSVAQRVAKLGLKQLHDQLQRRGINFDEKEKDDLKAVLLMLLIVIAAIFLLGTGKQRISNHWDFYFPT